MTLALGKRRAPVTVSVYFAGMAALCFAAGDFSRISLGLLFAAAHELGHLAAMAAFRVRVTRVCLTAAGVRIERPPGLSLSFPREIAVAAAGPAVSLALAGLFYIIYCLVVRYHMTALPLLLDCAALNLGFGLFNLLPVRQLDGGRALYFFLCRKASEHIAEHACLAASLLCLFVMTAGAAYFCLNHGVNLTLVVVVVYLAACC